MKILHDNFTVDGRRGEWRLDIYGDTHLGTDSVAEDKLKIDIAETKASGNYWCHVGDVIDGITSGDRRFNEAYRMNLAPWAWKAYRESRLIEAQWDKFEELFESIMSQGTFVLSGDGKHNQMGDISDCFKTSLANLGLPGGFPACFYMPVFNRGSTAEVRVPLMFHHGWFAGRTTSNKVIQLERALNQFPQVWGFICGHGHNKVETRVNSLVVEENKVTERTRRGAMTGSYLRTYAHDTVGYGEIKGYPPVAVGKITLVLRPFYYDKEKRIEFEGM